MTTPSSNNLQYLLSDTDQLLSAGQHALAQGQAVLSAADDEANEADMTNQANQFISSLQLEEEIDSVDSAVADFVKDTQEE